MRQLYFTMFFTLIFTNLSAQDCMMPDSIVLNTQAQIDNFAINYPDCTEIPGDISIAGLPPQYNQITNLEGLSHITKIEGNLTVYRQQALENFAGLEGLSTVLGGISVEASGCTDFSGLENLTSIGGYFEVIYNAQLTSFEGLENLNKIGGSFWLRYSSLAEQINLGIDSIGGSLYVNHNDVLTNLNLNELLYIGGDFRVADNNNLPNLSGMENLNYIGDNFWLSSNDNMIILEGIDNLSHIGGDFLCQYSNLESIAGLNNTNIQGRVYIEQNHALQNLDGLNNQTLTSLKLEKNYSLETLEHLENLNYIAESLNISQNSLTNLNGLNNLDSIGGNLSLTWNTGLHNLDGLENLKSTGGNVGISFNPQLEDIAGLSNLTLVGGTDSLARSLSIVDNDMLNSLEGLEGITALSNLHIREDNLQDIDALQNLTYVEWVNIESDNLTDLAGLQNISTISRDLIIKINGGNTSLHGLEGITSVGGNISIWNIYSLSGLNNLISVGNMTIRNSNAIDLSGLNSLETVSGNLVITDCNSLLTMNGLENLEHIGGILSIGNNNLVSLQALSNLNTINGGLWVVGNDVLTSLAGLENVAYIGERLWIQNNGALTTLEALSNVDTISKMVLITQNNALTSLAGLDHVNYVDVDEMQIKNNINLSLCSTPSLCDYIIQGGVTDISNNGQTCSNTDEILTYCEALTRLRTITFYDINQNKIQDSDEVEIFVGGVSFEPDMVFLYSNPVNQNLHYMPPGAYTVNHDPLLNPDWQLTTDSTSYFVSLEEGELEQVTFGIYPLNQISHIITTIASPPTRCNEFVTFDITTKNLGTTIASGTTWLQIDENIQQTQFIDQPDTTITSLDIYGWNFTDLYPGQSTTWKVEMQISGPPDFPIGSQLNFIAHTDFTDANGEDASEAFRYSSEVQCSYDPNDKLVNPSRYHYETLLGEDLIYTIRFQNTGNDVAYDVVIKDTLDTNLDLRTFHVLGSSHADKLSTSMTDEGVLTFEFRNIFLPDSTSNFEGSQGYVSYMIRADENAENNTVIRNSAGIYFDQNPPVITNTTLNVMVDMLTSIESPTSQNIIIFPNPNTGEFEVQGVYEGVYEITDISGRIIQAGDIRNNRSIDISNQAQGVYFITINSNNNILINKIIKHE